MIDLKEINNLREIISMDEKTIMDLFSEIRNDGKEMRKDIGDIKVTQAVHGANIDRISADVEFLKNKKSLFVQAATNPLVIKAALWVALLKNAMIDSLKTN